MPYYPIDYRSLLKRNENFRKENEEIIKEDEEFTKMQNTKKYSKMLETMKFFYYNHCNENNKLNENQEKECAAIESFLFLNSITGTTVIKK